SLVPQSLAMSPNGRLIAVGGSRFPGGGNDAVFLWDIADRYNPRPAAQLPHLDIVNVSDLAFSPDGRTLAAGGYNPVLDRRAARMSLELWDLDDIRRPLRLNTIMPGIDGSVESLRFSPDGHLLAAGGGDLHGNSATAESNSAMMWDITERAHPRRVGSKL